MRKISFGSFPLIEIKKEDRRCLDRYLIKTFSDNISISDAIRNLKVTKNLMYITPDSLMENWLRIKKQPIENANDRTSNNLYDQALKRAFFIIKEFYKKVKNAPFYKEYIYYPIYVEKIEKINVGGDSQQGHQYSEVQYNYSFVILSNDLTKGLKVDEIRYDENASVNFLFLFIEFFSGEDFGGSIHDFSKKDYEFLVQLYQFIERTNKTPFQVILDLYKLLALVRESLSPKTHKSFDQKTFSSQVESKLTKINTDILRKYSGMLKHEFVKIAEKMAKEGRSVSNEKRIYREAFMSIMSAVFKSEGLQGLYDDIAPEASAGERLQYVYNTNKYREILNLAKELVEYNKLDCNDVISKDPMDFDFSVESGNVSIDTQKHILAQKYQTFFKSYAESISNYLQSIIEALLQEINIKKTLNSQIKKVDETLDQEYQKTESDLKIAKTKLKYLDQIINRLEAEINNLQSLQNLPDQDMQQLQDNQIKLKDRVDEKTSTINVINNLEAKLNQIQGYQGTLQRRAKEVETSILNTSKDIAKELRDQVLGAIANDLTFVYDDGKTFFMDPLVAKGFLELFKGKKEINPQDFEEIIKNMPREETIKGDDGYEEPNPVYYAAQILNSLHNTFNVMAEDTIVALGDALRVSLKQLIYNQKQNTQNPGKPKDKMEAAVQYFENLQKNILIEILEKLDNKQSKLSKLLARGPQADNFKKTLSETIYRNRFLSHVLSKFLHFFNIYSVTKRIEYEEKVSELHPLIRKLIQKGKRCQYFKSYIISFDVCEQLYRLKYIIDTQKFISGISNRAPRKLNSPMNRLQTVLHDYLGLEDNPTWIISKQNVYLSMPDEFSLTGTSLLSNIPKRDLKEVCRIKASDYWNQQTMGKVARLGNKKIAALYKTISDLREQIEKKEEEKKNLNPGEKGFDKRRKAIDKDIDRIYTRIQKVREEIAKVKENEKENIYKPNAFLFGDDTDNPNQAEETPLLSKTEQAELERNKDEMRTKLLNLNPYSEKEQEELERQYKKIREAHPFDFEEPEIREQQQDREALKQSEEESELERLLREREEAEKRRQL